MKAKLAFFVGLIVCVYGVSFLASRSGDPEGIKNRRQVTKEDLKVFNPITTAHRMPAITGLEAFPESEASKELRDNELVMGIELNGEARAYPITMLDGPARECFNEVLGGHPIAITW